VCGEHFPRQAAILTTRSRGRPRGVTLSARAHPRARRLVHRAPVRASRTGARRQLSGSAEAMSQSAPNTPQLVATAGPPAAGAAAPSVRVLFVLAHSGRSQECFFSPTDRCCGRALRRGTRPEERAELRRTACVRALLRGRSVERVKMWLATHVDVPLQDQVLLCDDGQKMEANVAVSRCVGASVKGAADFRRGAPRPMLRPSQARHARLRYAATLASPLLVYVFHRQQLGGQAQFQRCAARWTRARG
jgi:hypothetical protein